LFISQPSVIKKYVRIAFQNSSFGKLFKLLNSEKLNIIEGLKLIYQENAIPFPLFFLKIPTSFLAAAFPAYSTKF